MRGTMIRSVARRLPPLSQTELNLYTQIRRLPQEVLPRRTMSIDADSARGDITWATTAGPKTGLDSPIHCIKEPDRVQKEKQRCPLNGLRQPPHLQRNRRA